jgi:hypothetical protein
MPFRRPKAPFGKERPDRCTRKHSWRMPERVIEDAASTNTSPPSNWHRGSLQKGGASDYVVGGIDMKVVLLSLHEECIAIPQFDGELSFVRMPGERASSAGIRCVGGRSQQRRETRLVRHQTKPAPRGHQDQSRALRPATRREQSVRSDRLAGALASRLERRTLPHGEGRLSTRRMLLAGVLPILRN